MSSVVIDPGTMVIGTLSSAIRRPVSGTDQRPGAALLGAGADHQDGDLGVRLDVLDHRVELVALAESSGSG